MISVVVLTFNEAVNLRRCLESARFSDDVLVLDSGSTDETCAIALAHGARVLTHAFDSFGRQRNYAMEHGDLRHEWVLHLDADELVPPELRDALLAISNAETSAFPAYRIPSKLMLMGRWLRHSGMYPAYQVRYGRREALRFIDHGHGQREALPPELIGTIDAAFEHYNFSKGLDDWYARHRRYALEEARQAMAEEGETLALGQLFASDATLRRRALKRFSHRLPYRPLLRFGYSYLLRRGFLDGRAGYRYARMLATYQGYIDAEMGRLRSLGGDYRTRPDRSMKQTVPERRVCFVNRYCYPDTSATSQLLTDLACDLVGRGWQVSMIGSRQRYDDPDAQLPQQDRWRGVDIRRVSTTRFGRTSLVGRAIDYLSFYVGLVPTLWSLLRRGDVVVAKTDPPLLGLFVAPIASLRGARTVNWLQDLFPEIASALGQPRLPTSVSALLRWLRNVSLRRAGASVAIGERMRAYLEESGIPPTRLALIPNWPHEDAIGPIATADSQLRIRLGLEGRFVVGYSGNLGRAHEWQPLFEAARLLVGEPRIIFLVGGGGYGYDALRNMVAEACLQNVVFQPYHPMETLSDAMGAADLHLVSLRPELEGLIVPSKFYGIAAAARPVGFIGDINGELARLIRETDCGFHVPTGDGVLLADAILTLSADPLLAAAQGGRARALLDREFSRSSAHDKWHHLLAAVASGAPPSPEIPRHENRGPRQGGGT